ncbi:carbohydrate-binding module family 50 [Brachionus plicatilis]|uniref:Carbohydrate-binding module family 50 n=1 Tax=Brachionus plicatilis TaxID=10195 RepID=A0A3M7QQV4_BRAPC|nr:carbohydrate-binding module family 50 [Brachionus plicatilis]
MTARHNVDLKCSVEHSITSIDTCNSIKSSYRLTDIRFRQLNPEINCNNLILGEKVCANDQNFGCLNYTVLPNGHNESCEKLAAKFSMSILTFRSINNWLDCDLVKNLNTFCSSKFSPACSEIYQVKSNDTYLSLIEKINSTELFHKANPFLDPDNLKEGQIICLKEKKNNMEIHLTDLKTNEFSKVLSSFGNIKSRLDGYLGAPSKQKSDEMQNEIIETMSFASEELEKNGLNNLCEMVQFDEDYPLTKACACDNIEPKSYCGILLIQETKKDSKRTKTLDAIKITLYMIPNELIKNE